MKWIRYANPSWVAALLFVSACAYAQAGQQQEDIPILRTGGPQATTELKVEVFCSDSLLGASVAELSWLEAEQPGSDYRVDLSAYRNGLQTGQYTVQWQMQRDTLQRVYRFDEATQRHTALIMGLEPGINYYWRVLTRTSQGWAPSGTTRLEVPVCPVDMEADTVPPPPRRE